MGKQYGTIYKLDCSGKIWEKVENLKFCSFKCKFGNKNWHVLKVLQNIKKILDISCVTLGFPALGGVKI